MVIKKKKEEKEIERLRFISKGGSPPKNENSWTTFCLRIPIILKEEMESSSEKRFGLSRNAWILEAIQDKIMREKKHD